jgi:hypothetical protein
MNFGPGLVTTALQKEWRQQLERAARDPDYTLIIPNWVTCEGDRYLVRESRA